MTAPAQADTAGACSISHNCSPGSVDVSDLLVSAWGPAFPEASEVTAAAALLPRLDGGLAPAAHQRLGTRGRWPRRLAEPEGPTWRITVGPGALSVGTRDYARLDRTLNRAVEAGRKDIDVEVPTGLVQAGYFLRDGRWIPPWAVSEDERTEVRYVNSDLADAEHLALAQHGRTPPMRVIREWSRKSRSRMTKTLCELDFSPLYRDFDGNLTGRVPAMVTLTYPGDWLTVAPSGAAAKKHLQAMRSRYARAWGEELVAVWKMEFQNRGAPHFHLLMCPPHGRAAQATHRDGTLVVGAGLTFARWLSVVWADIVGHPDPEERARHERAGTGVDFAEGLRASDPKRVAVYFLKHNAAGPDDKEYQHVVPEEWQERGLGPGRFWGYWMLTKAVTTVDVAPDDAVAAARLMRRWSRAQGRTRTVMRPRTKGGAVQPMAEEVQGLAGAQLVESRRKRYRRTTVRTVRLGCGRGWIAVNDGPAFAAGLARHLRQRREDAHGAGR